VALNELLRTLEAEAAVHIEEVRSRARDEAERLRRECEAELSRRRAETLAVREAELRAAAAREVATARREAARRVLEARAAILARIRSRVGDRLAARAADPKLLPLLQRDLRRGLGYVGENALVQADSGLLDGLRNSLDGRQDVTFEPAIPLRAGLVLHSADGSVTVDATLESRLDQAWPRFAIDLIRRLETNA
jgi:vacuolar-type H+-ATPase subunit E/Vma4